ncbi:hypothetical protein HER32_11655 [Hymenobacter sp. BT18]|uniref:hypothetical protein n=1 Tax=Hymenobacter sp. BT18 TaxID=2835648 RepID=UPI00143E3F33|nr:hypothetical protein [Hymenobacter sp. BT18]QIX61799.1 hypothetical protein HER32_11655 [Hymenobacter sp. BT18]
MTVLSSRFLLQLTLCAALLGGSNCARRKEAAPAPVAETVKPAPAAAPIKRTAARDLTDVMAEELLLSDEQQTKVRTLLRATVQQVNEARTQFAADKTALNKELMRINTESETQLRQVFSAEQFKQYQLKKRSMQAKMQARRTAEK